jgi:hypothetical protein
LGFVDALLAAAAHALPVLSGDGAWELAML